MTPQVRENDAESNDSNARGSDESGALKPTGRTPLPKLQLATILLIQFTEPLTATVIYPFIIQCVRDTGITGGDETKTGYYAGIVVRAVSLNLLILPNIFYRNRFSSSRKPRQSSHGVGCPISLAESLCCYWGPWA